jgi:hypothetical protein
VSLDANFELIDTGLGKTKSEKTLFCQELKKNSKSPCISEIFLYNAGTCGFCANARNTNMKTLNLLALAGALTITSSAFAFENFLQNNNQEGVWVEKLDAQGNTVGPARFFTQEQMQPTNRAPFASAWNGGGWNLGPTATALGANRHKPASAVGSNYFRMRNVASGPWIKTQILAFGTGLEPGTEGMPMAQYGILLGHFPDGGAVAGNTPLTAAPNVRPRVTVFTVRQSNDATTGRIFGRVVGGNAFTFTGFNVNGFFSTALSFPATSGIFLGAPAESGDGMVVQLAWRDTVTGLNVPDPTPTAGLSIARLPFYAASESPTPGEWTNPGSASGRAWVDMNNSGGFSTSENLEVRNILGVMPATEGKAMPAISYAVNQDQTFLKLALDLPTVSSNASMTTDVQMVSVDALDQLQNFTGGGAGIVGTLAGDFGNTAAILGANNNVTFQFPYTVLDGSFSLAGPFEQRYSVWIKPSHHLGKNIGIQDFTNGTIDLTGTPITGLVNGDVDEDNEVGPGDFEAVVTAFGATPDAATWDLGADLDEDGEIGPGDFEIVVANFGIGGDAPLYP